MNKAKLLKQVLTPQQVLTRIMGEPVNTRSGIWYRSPFRQEKVPSLIASRKGIHDFGEDKHYDIISFTQRLYGVDFTKAVKILATEFGIDIEDKYENRKIVQNLRNRQLEEKKLAEAINRWFNITYGVICDKYKYWADQEEKYKSNPKKQELWIARDKLQYLDYLAEHFRESDTEKGKVELYRQRSDLKCLLERY